MYIFQEQELQYTETEMKDGPTYASPRSIINIVSSSWERSGLVFVRLEQSCMEFVSINVWRNKHASPRNNQTLLESASTNLMKWGLVSRFKNALGFLRIEFTSHFACIAD
jgi:hypothetical protein